MSCYCNGTTKVKNEEALNIVSSLILNSNKAYSEVRIVVNREGKDLTEIIVCCFGGDDAGVIYDFYTVCLDDKGIYGKAVWEVDTIDEEEAKRYMEDEIKEGYVTVSRCI